MTIIEYLDKLVDKLPYDENQYKKVLLDSVLTIDFNQSHEDLRKQLTTERARLITFDKILWFIMNLQERRIQMIIDEIRERQRARFTKVDPVLEAEEIAFLDALERRRVKLVTSKPGESGGDRMRKKGFERLLDMGYSLEEAKKMVEEVE